MNERQKKVYVGLSGGVDSSVSAALLKQEGYDVTGVFIKVWHPEFLECTWKDDRRDAMRVCAHLDIPFKTLDLEKEYKQEVVDYMIREYAAGRTPNPDVMCNSHVKFGAFLKWALEDGADLIATGHYARIQEREGAYELLAGRDANKDQSYFLWMLGQHELAHALFPVGDMEKPQVRKLAEEFGLITATKKDSQGLCFLGHVDMKEFLQRFITTEKGAVLNTEGEVVGTHDGALLYTLGERHGFTITKKGTNDPRFYVVAKDIENNTITVSPKERPADAPSMVSSIALSSPHWVGGTAPEETNLRGRIRYRQPLQDLSLSCETDACTATFATPQEGVASGQSLVVYSGERCLGGGIIETPQK